MKVQSAITEDREPEEGLREEDTEQITLTEERESEGGRGEEIKGRTWVNSHLSKPQLAQVDFKVERSDCPCLEVSWKIPRLCDEIASSTVFARIRGEVNWKFVDKKTGGLVSRCGRAVQ